MKITYLGTAAAEGFPGVFCNCEYCREARKLGGKNIRTRSQAIINDDLLIDFPADSYNHFLKNNIEADKIRYLFVTHSHSDHFYKNDLCMRGNRVYAHNMREERLKMYANEEVALSVKPFAEDSQFSVDVTVLKPFDTVCAGKYTVAALPARHSGGEALFYMIKGEKNVLYAHDTGYFFEEAFEYIKNEKIRFDLISLDCTNIDLPISDEGSHMGIDNINRVVARLRDAGAIDQNTKIVVNHFSHNAGPIHHKLEERVADLGYIVSYDGLSIEI